VVISVEVLIFGNTIEYGNKKEINKKEIDVAVYGIPINYNKE